MSRDYWEDTSMASDPGVVPLGISIRSLTVDSIRRVVRASYSWALHQSLEVQPSPANGVLSFSFGLLTFFYSSRAIRHLPNGDGLFWPFRSMTSWSPASEISQLGRAVQLSG